MTEKKQTTIAEKLAVENKPVTPAKKEKPLVFPTHIYQEAGTLICPNGDKVRSDDDGLFCIIDGERVPYPVEG